jgi:hypothetical protein
VVESRRDIEGGVDRRSVHHGAEVGGSVLGEAMALGQLREED